MEVLVPLVVGSSLIVPLVVAVRCHIARSHGCKLEFSAGIRKSRAKKEEDSPVKLSRVRFHSGSLPQGKRAEVLENFLAAGIPLRKIDHLRGLVEAGGQHMIHGHDQEFRHV